MQSFDWVGLLSSESPWAHLIVCSERSLDNFVYSGMRSREENIIRIIRGDRCPTKDRLFQEWAAALQFPYYFGNNWDAWDECLADLDWLPATQYVFFVTNVDALLSDTGNDFTVFISILEKVAKEWARPVDQPSSETRSAVSFRVVFHSEAAKEGCGRQRLDQAGLELPPVLRY